MFLESDQVLFVSVHRYDKGTFYPGTTPPPQSDLEAGWDLQVGPYRASIRLLLSPKPPEIAAPRAPSPALSHW